MTTDFITPWVISILLFCFNFHYILFSSLFLFKCAFQIKRLVWFLHGSGEFPVLHESNMRCDQWSDSNNQRQITDPSLCCMMKSNTVLSMKHFRTACLYQCGRFTTFPSHDMAAASTQPLDGPTVIRGKHVPKRKLLNLNITY